MHKALRMLLNNTVFEGVSTQQSRRMRAIKASSNRSTELRLRMTLVRAGIRNWKLHPTMSGKPDFVFPECDVVIFADGCFWHGCPDCAHPVKVNAPYWSAKIGRNMKRDEAVSSMLHGQGFKVLRFWEHELSNDRASCVKAVRQALASFGEGRAVTS